MNITVESYGPAVAVNLKGELTEDARTVLEKVVEHQLEDPQVVDVLLNLEGVTFIDSAMLEYLLELQDKLTPRLGQVRLIHPEENVRKILEITRLARSFEAYETVADAVNSVHPQAFGGA